MTDSITGEIATVHSVHSVFQRLCICVQSLFSKLTDIAILALAAIHHCDQCDGVCQRATLNLLNLKVSTARHTTLRR